MSGVREYLLRLVSCGFLVSLCQSLASDEHGKRAVKLAGGCLMILVVLRPLIGLDFSGLPRLLPDLPEWRSQAMEQAEEKNDELMRELIASQTEALIRERAEALGLDLELYVEVKKTADGVFIPWSAELKGPAGETERQELEQFLVRSLDIPPQRQRWKTE